MLVAKFPPPPVATSGTDIEMVDGKESNTDKNISHTVSPVKDGGDSTKQRTSKTIPPQAHNHRNITYWLSVEWILSMLHEVWSQNVEVRLSLLFWICQNCSNSKPSTLHNKSGDSASAPPRIKKRRYIVGIIVLSPLQIHTVFYLAIKVFPQHRNKSCIVHASLIWWTSSKEKYVYAKKRKLWIHYMIATTQFGMCNTEA